MTVADLLKALSADEPPMRFTAFDGSTYGPPDAPITLTMNSERGLRYLLTAPGELGLARAYVSGELDLHGAPAGDPYQALVALADWQLHRPSPLEMAKLVRRLGLHQLMPPERPEQEALPRWRRTLHGLRHSRGRDAEAISQHYDVSNAFYEYVLGPSMAYTCAVFPKPDATLEEAQEEKFDLVCRKLGLSPGMRLLDVGCGWGGMAIHAARNYGVKVVAVTLSKEQAEWGQAAVEKAGLSELVDLRYADYRDAPGDDYDAISSIGMTEHIGVAQYRAYFRFLRSKLRDGGRLLNHCITRPTNTEPILPGKFIDRYVFPDGELTGSGRIIAKAQDVGFEVRHEENLREHYALTLKNWCANLAANWDACVAEAGQARSRIWGLYMAGSRLAFERNEIQLHQVLAVRVGPDGQSGFALRPTW